jgi:type I restriction enzyme S subunit
MTDYNKFQLSEVLEALESGSRPKGGVGQIESGTPSIGGEHITGSGEFDFTETRYVPEEFYRSLKRGKIRAGDILLVKDGATTGKVALVTQEFPFKDAAVNEHVFIVRPQKSRILSEYLFFFIYSTYGQAQIRRSFHGAAQGGINTQFAKDFLVPIPPIEVQRKISTILRKADWLRQRREQANQLTSEIIQSVFLKMFGDPARNPLELARANVESVCAMIVDGTHATPHYISEGIPCLSAKNVKKTGIDFDDVRFVSEQEFTFLTKRVRPSPGDILFSSIGTIGNARVVETDRPFCLIRSVTLLRPNTGKVLAKYLETAMNTDFVYRQAMNMARRVSVPDLFQKDIRELIIPLPSLDAQQKFARLAYQIEKVQQQQTRSAGKINELFHSLMYKAFTGQLVA